VKAQVALKIVANVDNVQEGGDLRPRAMMEGLALRLEEQNKRDPGDAAVARELRATLQALGAAGGGDDELSGFLDKFRNA
jgi:hypothetical protein